MFTPAVANYISQFYPLGNTPAVSLTRGLPQGLDADILLLGCGDARNVLYTAYCDHGLPPRRLDITCCDIEPAVLARNIFLYSLLLSNEERISPKTAWDVFYELFLDSSTATLVNKQAEKLLGVSKSLKCWRDSHYGKVIAFSDETTLLLVRDVWSKYATNSNSSSDSSAKVAFIKELQRSKDMGSARAGVEKGVNLTGLRSAAPLSVAAQEEVPKAYQHFWEKWSLTKSTPDFQNPLFCSTLSPSTVLHYGTDPILGFHLATAFASLAPSSPLRPDIEESTNISKVVDAAMIQFTQWILAFKALVHRGLKLRFVVADAITVCHVLQNSKRWGNLSSNLYRRQFDMSTCDLDVLEYKTAPQTFDVIDTSNLADHLGSLNLLAAATPLLKHTASSTIYLETLLKQNKSSKTEMDTLLCGHAPTVSLLLRVSAVEHWTNATSVSSFDEKVLQLAQGSGETLQVHSRMSWKLTKPLVEQPESYGLLHIDPQAVARIFFDMYLRMFDYENASSMVGLSPAELRQKIMKSAYPHFHRGSLVTMMKLTRARINTNWPKACETLFDMIQKDRSLMMGTNYLQELGVQAHIQGLHGFGWFKVQRNPSLGGFSAWKNPPEVVVLTLVVPRQHVDKLYASESMKIHGPTLQGNLNSSEWTSLFADLHLAFGEVRTSGLREEDGFEVVVRQDAARCNGNASLVASFYVPAHLLQDSPKSTKVGLSVIATPQNFLVYQQAGLGPELKVFETDLSNASCVFVTKHMPGMNGHPLIGNKIYKSPEITASTTTTKVSANVSDDSRVTTLTGRVEMVSDTGKQLLTDKVPIELRQASPFAVDIAFGQNDLVCPIIFPAPVAKEGSKTRIARKSGYVEVIAPLADTIRADCLSEYIFPMSTGPDGMPITLNSEHLNLDALPILSVETNDRERNSWMGNLMSFQFSLRQKRLRDAPGSESEDGITADVRLNFKQSLSNMLLRAAGKLGSQTSLFSLYQKKLGVIMLIFIQALRLNGASGSYVADAAVLPLTLDLVKSGKLQDFFLTLRELQIRAINVDDDELRLWKRVLPALAERCRTWSHKPNCEYKRTGRIPLSLTTGEATLCSCGNGELPKNFLTIPNWDVASKYATRIAISPVFAAPFLEDSLPDSMDLQSSMQALDVEKCGNCGKTAKEVDRRKLMNCTRCNIVSYCSKGCQTADWKRQHRAECTS